MRRNFPALSFVCISVLFAVARGQECDKPTDMEIQSLITGSLRDVNGDGGVLADITITQLNSTLACLASASTENKYQFVSVVAQYTRMDGSDPQYNQTGQFEFECASGSAWRTTGDELGTNSRENRNVSVDASRFSATERTDCFMCIKPGHSQLALLVGSSPVPDEVHHCLACSGCNDPQLCYLPNGFTPPARGACCNAYEGGMCVETCSAGTVLVANNRECMAECPTGLYNVSGVCENCTISCENGGTLVSDPNTCECQCGTIYNGSDCSGCKCENGGTCGGNSEQCDCPSDYSGMFCETCSITCQNGGTLNSGDCSCMCPEGLFTGDNCETPICGDNCMTCITSNGEPMCDECDDGYVLNSDGMCVPCDCQNGGTCTSSGTCVCPPNYTGNDCSTVIATNCPDGQYYDAEMTKCVDCPSNCKVCSVGADGKANCTECDEGFVVDDGGECKLDATPAPGGGCTGGCIAGIVIGTLAGIGILAGLIAGGVYAAYSALSSPATAVAKTGVEGLNGVAKDNPLYVDPGVVEETVGGAA